MFAVCLCLRVACLRACVGRPARCAGVLPSLDPVVAILTTMMKEDDASRDFSNLSLIREFAKAAGLDVLGVQARDQAVELAPLSSAMEEGDAPVISEDKREALSNLLQVSPDTPVSVLLASFTCPSSVCSKCDRELWIVNRGLRIVVFLADLRCVCAAYRKRH
eukprot:COSAG05_NODE_2843_length_2581_cov_1.765915_2_plen_163_part_00